MQSCIVLNIDCTTLSLEYVRQFSSIITDPPYSEHTHTHAVSQSKTRGARARDLGFQHLTDGPRDWLMRAAGEVARWSVIFSDVESTHHLREAEGRAQYIRTMPWLRWSMPQLTGDRPPQGHEAVVLFYGGAPGPKHWNGPGSILAFDACCMRGEGKHKAQKPLDLMLDLVSYFSDPGELVLDPFAGSGTTGLACSLLGRRFFGCELQPDWTSSAAARLTAPLVERDLERARRWLAPRSAGFGAPGDTETGPTGIRRAAARARDREIFLTDPRIAPHATKLLAA